MKIVICEKPDANASIPLTSGIARSLRPAAFGRHQASPRTFQPLKKSLAPTVSTRYASSDPRDGKIHQVIGAVVDGEFNVPHCRVETRELDKRKDV